VVVNDKTTTGTLMKNEVIDVIPYFKNKVKFIFFEDFDFVELQSKIKNLPSESIILLTVANRDRTGNFFAYEESLDFIYKVSKVPIYSVWEFYLGRGIVGGMLTSGFQQGKSAADITLQILNGEDVSTIPVIKKSPNVFMLIIGNWSASASVQRNFPLSVLSLTNLTRFMPGIKILSWQPPVLSLSLPSSFYPTRQYILAETIRSGTQAV